VTKEGANFILRKKRKKGKQDEAGLSRGRKGKGRMDALTEYGDFYEMGK